MEVVHERAPDGFTDIADVISQQELEAMSADYRRTAGFGIEELNSRPSLTPPAS